MKHAEDLIQVLREAGQNINPRLSEMAEMAKAGNSYGRSMCFVYSNSYSLIFLDVCTLLCYYDKVEKWQGSAVPLAIVLKEVIAKEAVILEGEAVPEEEEEFLAAEVLISLRRVFIQDRNIIIVI